ncbi:A disintegrin and metalloproteinase with thrombospondin motifs like isoform X3 [Neocloeon triangulifer]|uniref:A disintegrin and metalloproteinase with thrombospondin motifs like isoform X3 n=1 Tax=Neocloeon triangulifer TaxID=2078957 RepID=UPI00286EF128|nr:A disintegrin and metalloproteinase with thrombospondin motifs like isoform X3 [Neocloeon triangulifer]
MAAGWRLTSLLLLYLSTPFYSANGVQTGTNFDLHTHMSPQDLRSLFHVDSHDEVPEYQVVSVRALSKRSASEDGPHLVAHLEAFGRPLQLALRRTTGLAGAAGPSALRMFAQDGEQLAEIPQAEHGADIGHTYQDEASGAALLVHTDPEDGTLLVEGTIGKDLVVRPVPSSVRHLVPAEEDEGDEEYEGSDDEMFLDEEQEDEEVMKAGFPLPERKPTKKPTKKATFIDKKKSKRTKRSAATMGMHVVIRRSPAEADPMGDYAFMEPDHLSKRFRRDLSNRRDKREAPYVIYPEILVIVDYDGYRLHGGDNVQVKRYFVSFWNGVDLRYKLLKGPKVRISIAGIIISRGRDATPYLERNRVGRDAIDSAAALTDMGKYLFRERRLPVYDIAVAITKLDMCRRQYANDNCNRGTAGFAYVGGACVVNKRLEKVNSVAIIEDTGGFSGIIVAAHEVGHLLGAVHDGSPPPSYLGGPGAEKCRWEDGFIMSDLRHTEKGFRWSSCSVASFHHFLNGDTATCLFNAPHEDDALPRVLPGKLLSLDAQCRKDRGTSACFKDDRVCAQLFCFDANSGYCVAYRPAAEGSPCGDGQSCLNGRCVAEHENIIPDYTQITPTYARPDSAATQTRPVYAEPPDRSTNGTTSRIPWGHFWTRSTTPLTPATSSSTTTLSSTTFTTTTTYKPPKQTKSTTPYSTKNPFATHVGEQDSCEDLPSKSSASMSCVELLSRYPLQYCGSYYIKKHCCASMRAMCPNGTQTH